MLSGGEVKPHSGQLHDLCGSLGADREDGTGILTEGGIHQLGKAGDVLLPHKGLYRSGKATAVHAPRALFVAEVAIRKAKRQGNALLGRVFGGIDVL